MAPENKNYETSDPDQFAPEEGWPEGMFPSPVVDEYFNPYDNPQDKLDYHRLGGSQNEILRFTTLQALRRHSLQASSYPDHGQMVEQARGMIDRHEQRQRIKDAFRRRER